MSENKKITEKQNIDAEKKKYEINAGIRYGTLIGLGAIVPLMIMGVMTWSSNVRLQKILDQAAEISSPTDTANMITTVSMDGMISTGIAILSMAVTVWIGLNLYNVLLRNEVDSLLKEQREKVDRLLEEQRKEEETLIEEQKKKVDDLIEKQKTHTDTYISYLGFLNMVKQFGLHARAGEVAYFESAFTKNSADQLDVNALQRLELEYEYMQENYEKHNWPEVQNAADVIVNMIDVPEGTKMNAVAEEYYEFRKAQAYFYNVIITARSVGRGNPKEYLEKVKDTCDSLIHKHELRLDQRIAEKTDNSAINEYLAAIWNIYAYSLFLAGTNEDNQAIRIAYDNVLKLDSSKAKYYHNVGVFKQRLWNADKTEQKYKDTLKAYETAVKMDPNDYRALNNIGALILRRFDAKYIDEDRAKKLMCELHSFNLSEEEKEETLTDLRKAKRYLQNATYISPTFEDGYYNQAKALLCMQMLDDKGDYLGEALDLCEYVNTLNDKSKGLKFIWRNICEYKGDKAEAVKINASLAGVGDSDKIARLYKAKGWMEE